MARLPCVGDVIAGRYQVEGPLGSGATGVVLRVRHCETGRELALKLLSSPASGAERFRREARVLGGLDHPHVVAVTDSGVADELGGRPYLVTEYLPGPSLRDALQEPLERGLALQWLQAIAAALDHAHGHGIVHRDLKPDNVVLARARDGRLSPKVLDFGLARWWPAERMATAADGPARALRATGAGALVGTPAYAAPEQIRGANVGPAADVYALAVMAYEMLAGRLPFEGPVLDVLDAHLSGLPPRPPALPAELADALLAGLEKAPEARPPTATAFVNGLCAAHERARRLDAARSARPRRLALAALGALCCLGAPRALERSPWSAALEAQSRDARLWLLPARAPDARLVLVSIDDQSLTRDGRPLAAWGDDLGAFAARALDAGAAGVAIDLLLPRQHGQSATFVATLARHAERLVLAASADAQGRVTGPEVLDAVAWHAVGVERARALFGLVNVEHDADGVCRRARMRFHDVGGEVVPAWALRAARLLEPGLRARADDEQVLLQSQLARGELARLPWHRAVRVAPERWRGRLLLVGAEFAAMADRHLVTARGGPRAVLSGLEVQALLVGSLLLEPRVREWASPVPATLVGALAGLCVGFGVARERVRWAARGLAALGALYALVAALALRLGHTLVPLALPALALVAAALVLALVARLARPEVAS